MNTSGKVYKYVKDRGIKISWLAQKIGITSQALYLKFWGKSAITMEDSVKIKRFCRMTDDEYYELFKEEDWYNLL